MDKKKEFTPQEVAEELRKSMYKMVKKAIKGSKTHKESAQEVVDDILDPNYIAEVNPDDVPEEKDGVLWKKKKGVDKLKNFKKARVDDGKSIKGKVKARRQRNKRTDEPKMTQQGWKKRGVASEPNSGIRSELFQTKQDRFENIKDNKRNRPDLPKSEK